MAEQHKVQAPDKPHHNYEQVENASPEIGWQIEPVGQLPLRRGDNAPLLNRGTVLYLQRTIGNHAVKRIINRRVTTDTGVAHNRQSGTYIQRDAAEITQMSITPEYATGLSPDEIIERLRLLEREMIALQERGERQSDTYSTLYNNRRILRDALGDLGRTAEQEMIASTYKLPPLNEQEQARLRLVIGGSRAYEAIQHRQALMRQFHHNQRRGMGIANYTDQRRAALQRADVIVERELAALGLSNPQQLIDLYAEEMPRMVLARAKQVALGMLNKNEGIVRAELKRYGTGANPTDIEGLRNADQEIKLRNDDLRRLQAQLDELENGSAAQRNQSRGMGIANYTQQNLQRMAPIAEELSVRRSEFEQIKLQYGTRFPVLMAKDYHPGMYTQGSPEQIAERAGEPLHEVLDNIEEVREEIQDDDMKVWNIKRAVSTAMLEMGIADQPDMIHAIQRHIERQEASEAFLQMVVAALALGTTLMSGPLAPFVGAAWGVGFAAEGIDRYSMESAANNVALDPEVRDISANEPSLLWLVIDIAGAVIDLGAVLAALRPVARAAMASGKIAEFSAAARRLAPDVAERLVMSLRQRLARGAGAAGEVAGAAAHTTSGANRSLSEYIDALRAESHRAGLGGNRWDHANQPRGLPASKWEPGMPIDMPNTAGGYPPYDLARPRYWRNRAHFELNARQGGQAQRVPGNTLDPVKGLTDEQLTEMMRTGRAPQYAFPNRPGQTWELEHGVPQRVAKSLEELGLSNGEAARLTRASDPGNLMEVSPLEHAFFDAEAHGFGRLRGDANGRIWSGTQAADPRVQNPLAYMSDSDIRGIVDGTRGMDFSRTARTRALRDHLRAEIVSRRLSITPP